VGLAGCGSSKNVNTANTATKAAGIATAARAGTARPGTAATSRSSSPTPAAAGVDAAAVPTANSALKTGGTIQGIIVGTANLDPVENTTYRSQWLAGFHYARLFRFATGADPQININRTPVPDLVERYELSGDGLQYTMHLRQGVKFQPPLSRPLVAADVMASWDYFTTNVKNANNTVYQPIVDSLTAPDDKTLVFKLKGPYAPFINKLANTQYLWIMSKDAVDHTIDPATQPIGTGPWIFNGATATSFSWKKNPEYWNKGLPYADEAVLNIIPTTATQEAQFQAGAIDILAAAATDLDTIQKATPKAKRIEYVPDGLAFLFFYNVTAADSPFKDERVRRAASIAIDRKGLIDVGYSGLGVWCNVVPPGLGKWYLDPQGADIGDAAQWFKFDPKAARQMLTAAGHADTQFTFYYPNNAYGDVFNSLADATRGMLSDAGFKLQVVTVDYLKDWINPSAGYWVKGLPKNGIGHALQTPFTDPDDFLTGMLTRGGNRNDSLVDDPSLTALVKKQQVETDVEKRLRLVHDATRAADDAMYYVPLTYTKAYTFVQPWVQNYWAADDYDFGTETWANVSVNNK
jgi:ABC-type transport system substrate-binding protein